MKKEKEIIIGAWLLNLHKYVPDILPKDKNEAICYYHFLHLLDDMFSGKIHVDNYHSLFLCQQTLIEDYGGRAIHFQNYLNRLFFRLGHTFSLNKRKCEVFNYFYYFHHKLLQIFEKEYKYNEFRIIKFPYCEHKFNKWEFVTAKPDGYGGGRLHQIRECKICGFKEVSNKSF